ncbi:MAG: FprA family A-type flavoprotein [Bacillota bacterium]
MKLHELKKDLFWIGVRDPNLRVFDVIMKTEFGTTYNSYLIRGEKNILVETAKVGFYDEYVKNIEAVIGSEDIHYIISNHTEPDHSGSLKNLLVRYPKAQVICSKPASLYLRGMLNQDFDCRVVGDNEELLLGNKAFKFISAPFLHWPDTMFTYYIDEKVLFSGDVLGCHFCPKGDVVLDVESGDFMKAFKYYFDVIMGPFKDHAIKAMSKIENMDIQMVGTSHGPVLTENIDKYIGMYMEWSQDAVLPKDKKYILIGYVSAYGYTRTIAEELFRTMSEDNTLDVEIVDISQYDLMDIKKKVEYADGVLIGSPTFNQDALKPVWDALSVICPINVRNKPAAAFGSYGWSGEAVKMLEERMKSLKFKVVESGLRFNFAPSDADLKTTSEFAKRFIEIVKG